MSKRVAATFVLFVSICSSAIHCPAEDQTSHLEFIYQGLFGTYDESFPRTNEPTLNPGPSTEPDFGFDSRYLWHLNKFVSVGGGFEYRSYKAHWESHNLSGIFIDDATTKLIGVSGLLRAELPHNRLIPYAFIGAGYRHVRGNNDLQSTFRFPTEFFHDHTEVTLNKFGLEVGGGADLLVTKNVFVLFELDYFNAGSVLHTFGGGIGGGIRW